MKERAPLLVRIRVVETRGFTNQFLFGGRKAPMDRRLWARAHLMSTDAASPRRWSMQPARTAAPARLSTSDTTTRMPIAADLPTLVLWSDRGLGSMYDVATLWCRRISNLCGMPSTAATSWLKNDPTRSPMHSATSYGRTDSTRGGNAPMRSKGRMEVCPA
jgi:hypothetical protein